MKAVKTKQKAQELFNELKQAVAGEPNASDFYKVPLGFVIPRDVDDICATMGLGSRRRMATISRVACSSLFFRPAGGH